MQGDGRSHAYWKQNRPISPSGVTTSRQLSEDRAYMSIMRLDRRTLLRGAAAGGGLHGLQRGVHKAPFPPAAFAAFFHKGDRAVVCEGAADAVVILALGAGIEMDGNVIARRGESLRLRDDARRILVAEKNIGNFRH